MLKIAIKFWISLSPNLIKMTEIDFSLPGILVTQYFTTSFVEEEVLTTHEKLLIQGASGKRMRDFCTGRMCAKKALLSLNCSDPEILIGDDKEPLWPAGYTGSISHSHDLAGALVAKKSDLVAVGLDIEKNGRVKPEMWYMLYTAKEQEYLNSLPKTEQDIYSTLYFSMKESFYKLQHPVTKTFLGFKDVEIDLAENKFNLSIKKSFANKKLLPEFTEMHYAVYENHIICMCYFS